MDGCKRRSFTLIELLLCLALLTTFASLTCFEGLKAFDRFRYKQSVQRLEEELNFARHLSLSSRNDIHLALFWEKGELTLSYFVDDSDIPLDSMLRKKRTFDKIRFIDINGESLQKATVITFSPNLRSDLQLNVDSARSEPLSIKIGSKQ